LRNYTTDEGRPLEPTCLSRTQTTFRCCVGHSDSRGSGRANGSEESYGAVGEQLFHPDSFGYRPGKSALDAVGWTRRRCWSFDWGCDLDIKGFFDYISPLLANLFLHDAFDQWMLRK
jgi:hypothetical protein